MSDYLISSQKEYNDLVKSKFTGKVLYNLRGELISIHVGKGKNKVLIAYASRGQGFVMLRGGMIHCEDGPAIFLQGISDRYFYLENDCYINEKDRPSVQVFTKAGVLKEIRFFNEKAKLHNLSGPAIVVYEENDPIIEEFAVNGKRCSKEGFQVQKSKFEKKNLKKKISKL